MPPLPLLWSVSDPTSTDRTLNRYHQATVAFRFLPPAAASPRSLFRLRANGALRARPASSKETQRDRPSSTENQPALRHPLWAPHPGRGVLGHIKRFAANRALILLLFAPILDDKGRPDFRRVRPAKPKAALSAQ